MPKTDFSIDPLRLIEECLEQPELYFKYGEQLAQRRAAYDSAANAFNVLKAELGLDIRKEDPKAYDLPKFTEDAIANIIITRKSYKQAQRELVQLKQDLDIAGAALTAMEHRKRSLTLLVELNSSNYFAEPKITMSGEARQRVADAEKKAIRTKGKSKWRDDERSGDDE